MQIKIFLYNFYMNKAGDHLKFSTRSEQQEYWALHPLKQQHKPNDIITKQYPPDVTPQVKLIVNNDQRRNNVNYIPPNIKNNELQNYAHPFNQFDYLGQYCAKKINHMVYLKFFNNKYNMMADSKQRTRVMPAFYVPFQQIYSQNQSLFTKKLGFKFPQSDPDAVLPVNKNNRGCAFDPIFCSQFENGNLFAAIRKTAFEYELILQNDVNNCSEVGWFNFSVKFFTEGYYTFCIKNMTKNMTKLFKRGLRIYYCFLNNLNQSVRNQTLDDWNQIGQNIQYRQNSIQIENSPGEYYYDLYFEYKCKNKHEIVAFAMEKPYVTLDCQEYFTKTAPKKLRGLTKIERVQYGKTMAGTPLVAYLIKNRKAGTDLNLLTPNKSEEGSSDNIKSRKPSNAAAAGSLFAPENRHRTVFIVGRLGGQDVSSSSIIEGMVDFLLDTMDYDILKRTVNFYFIPIANVDGVKFGSSLTNLSGSNLFQSWRNPHKIYQAEIYYLKTFMSEINRDYPISHVFNFTSQFSEIYSSVIGTKNENEEAEDSRIFPFVLSKRHKMFSFQDFYFYNKNSSDSMTCVLTEMFPNILAYEFKISRFQFEKEPDETSTAKPENSDLKQCSSKSYFNFGRKLMEAYLEHVKIYDKNSLLKNKWMRDIQQIQNIKPKDQPFVLTQKPVEQRFPERFYLIKNVKQSPAKLGVKVPKKFDPYSVNRRNNRSLQNIIVEPMVDHSRNMIVRYCFADLNKKKKEYEMRAESLDENIKKTLGKVFEKSFHEKPQHPQFRIKEKSQEVLKSCNKNLLNFQMGIVSQQQMRKETSSPYKQKSKEQPKQKQFSLKKLKKVKNDNLIQGSGVNKDRSLMFMKP